MQVHRQNIDFVAWLNATGSMFGPFEKLGLSSIFQSWTTSNQYQQPLSMPHRCLVAYRFSFVTYNILETQTEHWTKQNMMRNKDMDEKNQRKENVEEI